MFIEELIKLVHFNCEVSWCPALWQVQIVAWRTDSLALSKSHFVSPLENRSQANQGDKQFVRRYGEDVFLRRSKGETARRIRYMVRLHAARVTHLTSDLFITGSNAKSR